MGDGAEVTEAIRALSVKFAEKREEAEQGGQQNETLSESNVGLHACAFADGAARFAKLCEGLSGQRAGQDLFSDRVTGFRCEHHHRHREEEVLPEQFPCIDSLIYY